MIVSGFVSTYVARSVKISTRPLAVKVLEVSGLTETKKAIDMAPLRAAGLLPITESARLDDRTFVEMGAFRTDRVELSLFDINRFKNRDQEISYFNGYAVITTGLPAQTPMTLLRPVQNRGYKRLRKFMMAHVDPKMRQEETLDHETLGKISVFGEGFWNEEKVLSADALRNIATFAAINALLVSNVEKPLSAHFGPDFCAVAVETKRSRLKIGGLLISRSKVNASVTAMLARLGRTLAISEQLIVHATTVPDGS